MITAERAGGTALALAVAVICISVLSAFSVVPQPPS